MKNRGRFYNASQFLSGYFHLDWKDDFDEPEEAVAQFIKDSDRQMRADALDDLRQIVAEFHGPDLNRVMLEIDCYYSPERYRGVPMREWLNQVIMELENSISH